MKKYTLLLFIMLFSSFILSSCNKITDSNNVKTASISKNVKIELTDDNGEVWLDNSCFEKIEVKTGEDGIDYIEFVTTQEGKTKLLDATAENLGKPLTLTANNKLLFSPTVMTPIENGIFYMPNYKTYDANYIFNLLIDAPDKMQGVKPPQYIISVDEVKVISFDKADVTPEEVTKFEYELEFDEEWMGWKYDIDFSVENIKYECEINAVSGTVIKFN